MPSSLNGTGVTFNDATTLQSGNIPAANLGSGTANSSTFLRGDKTWQTAGAAPTTAQILSAVGSGAWGAIGTYTFAYSNASGSNISLGGTLAGSNLNFVNSSGYVISGGLSGTWRNMGSRENAGALFWFRVS